MRIWGRLFEWIKVEDGADKIVEILELVELVYTIEMPEEKEVFISGVTGYIRAKFYEAKKNLKFLSNKSISETPFIGLN